MEKRLQEIWDAIPSDRKLNLNALIQRKVKPGETVLQLTYEAEEAVQADISCTYKEAVALVDWRKRI